MERVWRSFGRFEAMRRYGVLACYSMGRRFVVWLCLGRLGLAVHSTVRTYHDTPPRNRGHNVRHAVSALPCRELAAMLTLDPAALVIIRSVLGVLYNNQERYSHEICLLLFPIILQSEKVLWRGWSV